MVDAISGGRLEFGIGSGNTEMDYRLFGVTREDDRQRSAEALEIILKSGATSGLAIKAGSGSLKN